MKKRRAKEEDREIRESVDKEKGKKEEKKVTKRLEESRILQ